jgi:hypothetical protein
MALPWRLWRMKMNQCELTLHFARRFPTDQCPVGRLSSRTAELVAPFVAQDPRTGPSLHSHSTIIISPAVLAVAVLMLLAVGAVVTIASCLLLAVCSRWRRPCPPSRRRRSSSCTRLAADTRSRAQGLSCRRRCGAVSLCCCLIASSRRSRSRTWRLEHCTCGRGRGASLWPRPRRRSARPCCRGARLRRQRAHPLLRLVRALASTATAPSRRSRLRTRPSPTSSRCLPPSATAAPSHAAAAAAAHSPRTPCALARPRKRRQHALSRPRPSHCSARLCERRGRSHTLSRLQSRPHTLLRPRLPMRPRPPTQRSRLQCPRVVAAAAGALAHSHCRGRRARAPS